MAELRSSYDHLYLSPHFDDAALSCGGQIFGHIARGESVLVVTITAGDPPPDPVSDTVASLHRRWSDSLGDAPDHARMVAQRRAEDRAAWEILRADYLHLPFRDCIYRCGPDDTQPLYPGPTDMFGPINPEDAVVVEQLAEAFGALPTGNTIYLPLGVGRHVDHQVTRRAGEAVFGRAARYYEDYPYTMAPGALEAVLPTSAREEWTAETIWLDDNALRAKIAAVAAYRSQLSSFFASEADLFAKLYDEARRVLNETLADPNNPPPVLPRVVGGERVWRHSR